MEKKKISYVGTPLETGVLACDGALSPVGRAGVVVGKGAPACAGELWCRLACPATNKPKLLPWKH